METDGIQTCTTCGSSQGFEEISGLYYCLTCNTQRIGFTLEVRQYEEGDWNLKQLAFDDRNRKTRKKRTFNPGEAWTMVEAYNIILNHQCSQLEKGLNLGPQFRVILFSLWTEYLAKGELAFTGKSEDEPKSHINSSYRDLQIIGEGRRNVEQLPQKSAKKSKEKAYCGLVRFKRHTMIEYGEKQITRFYDLSSSDDENKDERYKKPVEGNYDEDVEESRKPETDCVQYENCDLDDVPMEIEWDKDMDDNFLFNYSHNPPAIEDGENFADYESDGSTSLSNSLDSSVSSEQFSPLATKATSSVLTNERQLDINGLEFAKPISRPRIYQKLKRKARSLLERFDKGADFDSLMKEIVSDDEIDEEVEPEKEKEKEQEEEEEEKEQQQQEKEKEEKEKEKERAQEQESAKKVLSNKNSDDDDDDGGDGVGDDGGLEEKSSKIKDVELTKRSQLLEKIIGDNEKDKNILSHANYITIERMTIHRTLQFILLAFRITGYNVHVGDIIHWIFMGHLTYFGAINVLPEKWITVSNNDIIHLQPKRGVNSDTLDYQTAFLRKFLAIPALPHPDFIEMLTRHLYDLNLPLRFVGLITKHISWSTFKKISSHSRVDKNSKFIPCYEIFSICSILVILKKIFILNGSIEKRISKNVCEKWPESFIWNDWFSDNQAIWKLMNRHYFPLNKNLYSEISDIDVIRYHRDKIANNWFGSTVQHNQRFYFLTKEFKADFSKAMEESFKVESCEIDPPPLTVYHFYEVKKFIAKRINQIRISSPLSSSSSQSMNIFDADYTNKSIDYLSDKSFTRYSPISAPETRTCDINEWPESIRLLVKLSSFITNRPPDKIIWHLIHLDKIIHL